MTSRPLAFALILLLPGCTGSADTATTVGDSGSSDGSGATTPSTGAVTDAEPPSPTAESDTGGTSAATDTTPSGTTEDALTTGDVDSTGIAATSGTTGEEPATGSCADFCARGDECQVVDNVALCTSICEADLAASGTACNVAAGIGFGCVVALSCPEFIAALETGQGSCAAEQSSQSNLCAACSWGAGGDQNGTHCSLDIECPDDPVRELQCDTETCACIEDGQQVGECAAEAACLDLKDIVAKGVACCGFPAVRP